MKVLGIETSCDETAAAAVEGGKHILSSIVASQVDLHARYGGIVPEVASRQHILTILPVLERALGEAGVGLEGVEAIAVTSGPGLPGSLLVGMSLAKALALARKLPLVGVNHLEAHLYSLWLAGNPPPLPALALLVSGGHTELVLMRDHGDIQPLGRTRDDAAGEALDKAARLLGLGYPGGPAIEKAARQGEARFPLPRAWIKGSYDFSFSGLKAALRRMLEGMDGPLPVPDLAASFQQAVVDMLVVKTLETARSLPVKAVLVAGGVAANTLLREIFLARSPLPVLIPPLSLCTDNAAMVAACGYFRLGRGERAPRDLDIAPSLPWG
ncbi:MAG: tRNA (adenosine(37)-N6)-threonylcarbamoyltransferase complex transferase subunit TsaD [Chloroflexi bacterium]|nr:tRNA (adenosine(37)-N6)-threonylcarbamoyltransferase complex transferase subunit TsaD [Chloroflexota bacterium]